MKSAEFIGRFEKSITLLLILHISEAPSIEK